MDHDPPANAIEGSSAARLERYIQEEFTAGRDIAVAQGIIMERFGLSATTTFFHLTRAAAAGDRTLRAVALDIVDAPPVADS